LQRRLRPGSRKLKQPLPFLIGFGVGGRENRLFGVLPELIRYRHGPTSVPPIPQPAFLSSSRLVKTAHN
jgi:hypothetical protein